MKTKEMTRRTPTTPYWSRDPFFGPVFERLFNVDPFRGESLRFSEDLMERPWSPSVDVKETKEAFILEAELPGLSKDDIHITLEDSVLRLTGERRFQKEEEKENYHRIERAYGSFSRSFTLGSGVDPSRVQAAFKDGVLTLTVPKSEESKPREIAIH